MNADSFSHTPLGKQSEYPATYTPSLLCAIPRSFGRDALQIDNNNLPFTGVDIWNAYELSWLDERGKPQICLAELQFPCTANAIIESKSLKLYLGSFNSTRFDGILDVQKTLESDLLVTAQAPVAVKLSTLEQCPQQAIGALQGESLDDISVAVDRYQPDPSLLSIASQQHRHESVHTHLFRSLCPVTGQPDWASVYIAYSGRGIDRGALLRYLISYREHQDFHEQCVERIFMDINEATQPERLTVYARYLRRGGLDINPFRTNAGVSVDNIRLVRQ